MKNCPFCEKTLLKNEDILICNDCKRAFTEPMIAIKDIILQTKHSLFLKTEYLHQLEQDYMNGTLSKKQIEERNLYVLLNSLITEMEHLLKSNVADANKEQLSSSLYKFIKTQKKLQEYSIK